MFAVFSMSLVCVVGALILHTFQDLSLLRSTLFIMMFKVLFEMPIFIVFGGWTPIGWKSKPLLQSFNFRSFCINFSLKSVLGTFFCMNITKRTPKMHFVLVYKHLRPVPNPTKPCAQILVGLGTRFWHGLLIQPITLKTPPLSPAPFWSEGVFQGETGGDVYFEAPFGRNFIRPPLFYTPPTPRRVFAGVGRGCIKSGPANFLG